MYYHPYNITAFCSNLYNHYVPHRLDPLARARLFKRADWEDDNNALMEKTERQSRRARVLRYFSRSSVPRPVSTLPKTRVFRWSINCMLVPETHHATNEPWAKAPWIVCVRFMFIDVCQELEDRSPRGVYNWRDQQTELLVERKVKPFAGKPGRRFVFSQDGFEYGHRMLKGKWLVVAYVWSQSQEWQESVDVRELVSWGRTVSIHCYRPNSDSDDSRATKFREGSGCYARHWLNVFYHFERRSNGDPCRYIFANVPAGYKGVQPLAIFFGTPVPERLQALCDLMDTNLRLLLRNGKEPLESRSPDEEKDGSRER